MDAHRAALAVEYRAVVMETAEEESRRRKLLSTRHILLKQLQEAEKREIKERFNVSCGVEDRHQCLVTLLQRVYIFSPICKIVFLHFLTWYF